MKKSTTKHALLLSALSLLLCVSMLVGTTFAWFTDSVTSGRNQIVAGNLDVELEYSTDMTAWTAVDANTNIFDDAALWEPGYTQVVYLRVSNVGSLALKYQLGINIASEIAGVNKAGESFKLSDHIEYGLLENVTAAYADRDTARDAVTAAAPLNTAYNKEFELLGKAETVESDTFALVVYMPESVGNEANHNGTDVPQINLGLTVAATQLTYEEDSFDNQYDVQATYLNQDEDGAWLITNMDELFFFASDVNSGNTYNGETVKLTADIDLSGYNWVPIGRIGATSTDFTYSFRGTFDGQDHTISNVNVSNVGWAGVFGIAYKPAVIKNLKVDGATINSSRMTGTIVGQIYGNVENCHVEDATITVVPNKISSGYDNGDKVGGIVGWLGDNGNNHYIKNCSAKNVTLKAYRDVAGIAGYIGTSSTVEGCSVDTVSVTIDQATNHYGVKDANAGGVVGRIYSQPVTVQNNTEANVTLVVPTYVSSADEVKALLAAESDGTTIYLNAGTYEGLSFTNPANYKAKNVTVVGMDGAVIAGFAVNGWSADNNIAVDGLTFKNVTFTKDLLLSTKVMSKVTVEDCVFLNDACVHQNDRTEKLTDLVVTNCSFEGAVDGNTTAIMLENTENVTVSGCSFKNIDFNVLQTGALSGTVLFDNNTVNGTGDRVFRFVDTNADITISNNVIVSDGDDAGELAKSTNAIEITLKNNTWNGETDVAVADKLINITAK